MIPDVNKSVIDKAFADTPLAPLCKHKVSYGTYTHGPFAGVFYGKCEVCGGVVTSAPAQVRKRIDAEAQDRANRNQPDQPDQSGEVQ